MKPADRPTLSTGSKLATHMRRRRRRAFRGALRGGWPLAPCPQHLAAARLGEINFDWPAASNEPKQGTRATHFVRYEEVQLGKAAAQVMVLFAERGVKEGQEITWSYGDSYRSHRKEMGYRAGTRADPNAITPQQARTAFARYCKKIDVTKEELAWNFGCISASQSNEQEAVLVRELILSNNKRLYHGAQSAADRTAATADMAETSVKQRAAGMEGGSDGDGDGDGGEGEEGGPLTPDSERGREERGREEANATCAEDEDINWDDAAEGIGEGIEGPEGFRDSDDDDEERGGDGGATRRRGEIANGPSREGDGGARGNNGDATDDANRGTDAGGDGEGDSDVEVDATVSRAPPKKGRTAMEVTEWRANGTIRKGRARRMEKEVPRRPWWRGGTGGRKKGEEDERPAQTASRQRLLAISRHSPRTLATWEGFVKDGLKNIRTKKRRREEPARGSRRHCPHSQLLLWCYGSLGIAAHNMLWAAMGGPSRVHGVMAREATPDCSPLEFSLRALPRARARGRFGIDRQIFSLLPSS